MIKNVFVKSPYNYDMDKESELTGLLCEEETLAQQQFAEESDINTIVRRFGLTGEIPENFKMPVSGDFTNIPSFEEAQNMIRAAQEAFDQVPAHIRARFDNNPQKLMNFLDNEENKAEALKLGLIQHPPEKTRDMITAVDELAAKLSPTEPKPKEK